MESNAQASPPFCPSARPNLNESFAFGIAAGTVKEPRISYLQKVHPVTEELLALAEPVTPTEVFRFAAPCAGGDCIHFDGANCTLAGRIVDGLNEVSQTLPACQIRSSCRWWQQEGKAACLRCPQIVTDNYSPVDAVNQIALANPV
jgi:hypothetical protein